MKWYMSSLPYKRRELICRSGAESFFLCWLFCFLAGTLASSTAEASQYSIHPSDDTFVSNYTGNGSNYGLEYLYLANTRTFLAYAYLKFPLVQIPENEVVDNATLGMSTYAYGSRSVISVSYVAFDDWTEETITWHNHPSDHATPVILDSKFVEYTDSYIQFDLLKNIPWPIPFDIEDASLTLLLTLSYGETFLASTSNLAFDLNWLPTLNITTHTIDSGPEVSNVPLPSSLAMILSGLMALRGSACLLRRKRQLPSTK